MKTFTILIFLLISTTVFGQNSTTKEWNNYTKTKQLNFNDTLNLLDAEIAPTYKVCENSNSNLEKINCLNTNLSIYTNEQINRLVKNKKINIKKGINKFRVNFFITENGSIIVNKITGNYPINLKNSILKVIEKAPKLSPAKQAGKSTTVKYSIKMLLLIK